MDQAKLPALGYASPIEELAERFHASPGLLQALNARTDFTKAEVTVTVPNVLSMPPGKAANVVVSKSESSVRAYDAEGKLLAFFAATIGSEHDPLPVGDWKIRGVSRNPEFHYTASLFWDSKSPDEKAVLPPGPNSPVGSVWIDLSREHYGIHGTPEPSMIGHTTSHGCIRLTNWDALELAAMVKPGTPAILKEEPYASENGGVFRVWFRDGRFVPGCGLLAIGSAGDGGASMEQGGCAGCGEPPGPGHGESQ